jgi:hypothetical protein
MRQILWRLIWVLVAGSLGACSSTHRASVNDYAKPYPAARVPMDAPRATGSLAGTRAAV